MHMLRNLLCRTEKKWRKLVGVSLSTRFREVVQLQTVPTPRANLQELLVRVKYTGINASDVNWTAGRYIPGIQLLYDIGFKGIGKIVEVGRDCEGFNLGDLMHPGSFSEYVVLTVEQRADPLQGPHLPLAPGEWVHCVHQSGEGRGGEER